MPGLSIRMFSIGVGLSHAATVRLVDRLAAEDWSNAVSISRMVAPGLYLTAAGKVASDEVLSSRDEVIAEGYPS